MLSSGNSYDEGRGWGSQHSHLQRILPHQCPSPPLLSLVSFPGVHEGLMSKGHMSWETDSEHFLVNSTSQSLLTFTLLSAGISIEIEVPL